MDAISHLWYPSRVEYPDEVSAADLDAFIESRGDEYAGRLEDEFAARAVNLGVESGMVLDVGTQVGLTALKILWQKENLVAIGLDTSGPMVERARETAAAWELGERAVFQVGDPRRMRFKTAYFDIVVSDRSLHRFDDATAIVREIRRVLKPTGALLIRDYRRPSRLKMIGQVHRISGHYRAAMRPQLENAIQAAYTPAELTQALEASGFRDVAVSETDSDYVTMERRGSTDPNSWVTVREQYR